jgi:hypothetical protein
MDRRAYVLGLMRWVRGVSDGILKGWPEDKFTFQSSPNDNHAAWVMGHLAHTDAWIAGVVGAQGVKTPETYAKLFGMGSKPLARAGEYPSPANIRRVLDETRAGLIRWVESASDEQLAMPLTDKTEGFASDVHDALMKLCWHEGWHMGQVATLRRTLGLPPVMG